MDDDALVAFTHNCVTRLDDAVMVTGAMIVYESITEDGRMKYGILRSISQGDQVDAIMLLDSAHQALCMGDDEDDE